MTLRLHTLVPLASLVLVAAASCSGNSSSIGATAQTGQTCTTTSQCYPGLDAAALLGQARCLTQLQNGYCTHTCQSDADCCAVAGECSNGLHEVCASFESAGTMYCFLSCAASDIAGATDAATTDAAAYCQRYANASFTCRSTGGGSANRRFCGP